MLGFTPASPSTLPALPLGKSLWMWEVRVSELFTSPSDPKKNTHLYTTNPKLSVTSGPLVKLAPKTARAHTTDSLTVCEIQTS